MRFNVSPLFLHLLLVNVEELEQHSFFHSGEVLVADVVQSDACCWKFRVGGARLLVHPSEPMGASEQPFIHERSRYLSFEKSLNRRCETSS